MNKVEMTLLLTTSCLEYLCRDHHNPGIPADEIQDAAVLGVYRLHTYAVTMWLPMIEQYLSLIGTNPISSEFLDSLEEFATHRFVAISSEEATSSPPIKPALERLKDSLPEAHQLLAQAMEFRLRCDSSGFQLTDGKWAGYLLF